MEITPYHTVWYRFYWDHLVQRDAENIAEIQM